MAPAPAERARTDGVIVGRPSHAERNVLKFCTFVPSVPSSRTCPDASNSVKFGNRP
jgi:hypothetical protein